MRFIIVLGEAALELLLLSAESLFWIGHFAKQTGERIADAVTAYGRFREGQLHCPDGHVIETTGDFACGACGFIYHGNIFLCPNPECPAPVTEYISCETCQLSVRNPYRWGRP